MQYSVNQLLTDSRLPSHFYSLVTGEPAKNNPGDSIRSYVIANCLQLDFVDLPEPLAQVALANTNFSTDPFVMLTIVDRLQLEADRVIIEGKEAASLIADKKTFADHTWAMAKLEKVLMHVTETYNRMYVRSKPPFMPDEMLDMRSAVFDLESIITIVEQLSSKTGPQRA